MKFNALLVLTASLCGALLLAGQPMIARADDASAPSAPSTSAPSADSAAATLDSQLSEEQINALISTLTEAMTEAPAMGDGTMAPAHSYFISKMVDTNFDDTVAKLKEALTAEKFAVLTEIDLQAKFKDKLQIDIPHYTIFGACGAKWAYAIWEKEFHIGALMPCNVVVAEHPDGKVEVFFKDPGQLPMATGNADIADTVATVRASVEKVLAAL